MGGSKSFLSRLWAMMGEARVYEDLPDLEEAEADIGSEFQKLEDEFPKQGHELIDAWRGKQIGHKCIHCKKFQAKKNFNSWLKGEACKKAANGRQRKAAFEDRHKEGVKAARRAREEFTLYESGSENEEGPKKRGKDFVRDKETHRGRRKRDERNQRSNRN